MAVKENVATAAEQRQEEQEVRAKEDALSDDLLDSLGFSKDEDNKSEDVVKKTDTEGGKVKLKRPLNDHNDNIDEDADEDEDTGKTSLKKSQEDEEDDDEDVIPKSKFEKRIKSEIEKRKALEARLAQLEEQNKKEEPSSTKDKLKSLSESELDRLLDDAEDAWFEAKQSGDADKARQLQTLKREIISVKSSKIVDTIKGPEKFQQKQIKAFNDAAQEIVESSDYKDIDFNDENIVKEIKEIATEIFVDSPELQKSETGQARALKMAVKHYQKLSGFQKGKTKESELKRQVTNLKRKTSLDSSSIKGNARKVNINKLYEKAKNTRDFSTKENYAGEFLDVDKYLD